MEVMLNIEDLNPNCVPKPFEVVDENENKYAIRVRNGSLYKKPWMTIWVDKSDCTAV